MTRHGERLWYWLALVLGLLVLHVQGKLSWQQITPKPTNYDLLASYSFNGSDVFTTGHSALSNSEYTGGILVRNGDVWEYTSCYPYPVITIEALTYVPHLNKILGVGGSSVVSFDPKNISAGCSSLSIASAYRLYGITSGNGVILALNLYSSMLFISKTGTYWTEVTKLPFQDFGGLLWDDTFNHFKLTSKNGTFVSVNGTTWTRLASNNDSIVLHTLKLYGNKLVGTGYDSKVWLSDNSDTSLTWRDISPVNITQRMWDWQFPLTSAQGTTILASIQTAPAMSVNCVTGWLTHDFGATWQVVWQYNNSLVPTTVLRSRNQWLIGGKDGLLMSTSDWTTFTTIFPSYVMTSKTLHHVAFMNGQFVIAAADAVYQSVDGYAWSKVSDDGFYSVTYSPLSKLYIGIPGAGIYTSPDMKNWTLAKIESADNRRLFYSHVPLVTKEGYLVVSGQIGDVFYPTGLWLSTDGGYYWQKLALKFSTATCGQFLARLGYANNTVYLSCPGAYPITMSNANISATSPWQRETDSWFAYMTGGQHETLQSSTLVGLTSVWGNNNLVLRTGPGQWKSTAKFQDRDGYDGYNPLARNQLYLNGKFWTLLRSGLVYTSTDGTAWETQTIPMYGIRSLAYGNGRYVAVGDNGIILVGKETDQ